MILLKSEEFFIKYKFINEALSDNDIERGAGDIG